MATKTRARKPKRITHEWTPALEAELRNTVSSSPTLREAFMSFASAHDFSSGAVQQHWYAMKRRDAPTVRKISDFSSEDLIEMQEQITGELKARFEQLHQLV